MAKGRKLTTSRSERLLGSYAYGGGNNAHGMNGGGADVTEFGEEDVWSIVDSMVNGGGGGEGGVMDHDWSPQSPPQSFRSRRRLPRNEHGPHMGGLSLAFDDSGKTMSPGIVHQFRSGQEGYVAASPRGRHHVATSAPVNVPDWSKIYRVDSVESIHDSDECIDERDFDMVPPHEYLVRSRMKAANSVFEGVGRTLKGRDLSRVRDTVWSQTGFDG